MLAAAALQKKGAVICGQSLFLKGLLNLEIASCQPATQRWWFETSPALIFYNQIFQKKKPFPLCIHCQEFCFQVQFYMHAKYIPTNWNYFRLSRDLYCECPGYFSHFLQPGFSAHWQQINMVEKIQSLLNYVYTLGMHRRQRNLVKFDPIIPFYLTGCHLSGLIWRTKSSWERGSIFGQSWHVWPFRASKRQSSIPKTLSDSGSLSIVLLWSTL